MVGVTLSLHSFKWVQVPFSSANLLVLISIRRRDGWSWPSTNSLEKNLEEKVLTEDGSEENPLMLKSEKQCNK